jgi:hypothetical protein
MKSKILENKVWGLAIVRNNIVGFIQDSKVLQ